MLSKEGKYCAIYTNFESATALREDIVNVNSVITSVLLKQVQWLKIENFDIEKAVSFSKTAEPNMRFGEVFSYLSENISKPLVLFIDEVDSLVGDSLLNIFNQLRSGYTARPVHFPYSIINQLVYRLEEERVQRVIAPMLNGLEYSPNKADAQYCIDLGLIKKTSEGYAFSNGIYKEIIPRE